MKCLLVTVILLLLPLVVSKKFGFPNPPKVVYNRYDEPRPEWWRHSETPYTAVVNFFWCRPEKSFKFEMPPVYKYLSNALQEQEKWVSALMRDAAKPTDETVTVEMVVLRDEEKYRDWDPVWVRKVQKPEISRMRIFLNEATDSEISEYCRQEGHPSVSMAFPVNVGRYLFKMHLICKLGTPNCEMGKAAFLVPIVSGALFFWGTIGCARFVKKMKEDVRRGSDDERGGYKKARQEYQDQYQKKEDVQRSRRGSFPENEQLPPEFRIIEEPEGPFEDPFPMDPQVLWDAENVRKPLYRKYTEGVYEVE